MYKYFKEEEFHCKCGNCPKDDQKVSSTLIELLDSARFFANTPFVITSGYRCKDHNKAVGGVSNSAHTKGLAADISYSSGKELYLLMTSLLAVGFKRIGISKNFVHVDIDTTKPQNVIWDY